MAVIGSSVLSATIGKVVDLGFNYMVDQYEWQTGMKDELLELKRLLPRIQAVVQATGKGHLKIQGPLKDWWWQLKDALDAAEDVVDDFEYLRLEEQVRQQTDAGEENQPHKVRKVLSTLSRSKENIVKIGKRAIQQDPILKSLRGAVKMLHAACNGLDAFVGLLSNEQQRQHQKHVQFMSNRETGSLLTENKVIGRKKERKNILEWLQIAETTEDDSNYENVSLLSIVGHGGMGKTTLAQLVFNDETVQKSFDLKIWVCVSTSFDVKGLTKQILQSVNIQKSQIDVLAVLQNALKEKLRSSGKFLLVLDDVWSNENISSWEWEKLFVPFTKYGQKGSKILLTTREDQVADMAARAVGGSKKSMMLEGLQDDDYFHLFNRYAFAGVSSADYRELQSIGSQIARRLWGSPLVAKTVGGMLNSNLDEEHWNNILHSNIFKLEEDEEGILSVLRLTYHNLPEHLRPCFAYCSIFPQDHEFDKDDLIRIWIATGLIQQSQNQRESLEDVGCRYFDDLLKRSFFERQIPNFLPIKYIMHDLLHDLAQSVSDGECFRFVGDMPVEDIPDTVRHLFLQTNVPDVLEKAVMRCKNLRTLLLFFDGYEPGHSWAINNMLKSLKSMRVMHLSVNGMRALPDGIGDSKHLRYLKLHRTVQELPTTLCRLYHLQVIVRRLPFSLQQPLFALPTNVKNLICLRHLTSMWGRNMIAGIGKLTSLQELRFTIMKEDGHKIGELKDLRELRELGIQGLENVQSSDEAREAELLNKKHLRHLHLWFHLHFFGRRTELDEQVLDCLQPHSVLKKLDISGYGGVRSANWMQPTLINNLEHINLKNCSRWEKLPHLSKLPFLRTLHLCHFPALKLWDEQPESRAEAGAWFPCLQYLGLEDCPMLNVLPSLPLSLKRLELDNVGLASLPALQLSSSCSTMGSSSFSSLSELKISDCPKLVSLADGLLGHHSAHRLTALTKLCIFNCEELLHLPLKSFRYLCSLKFLELDKCPKLQPSDIMNLEENFLPSSLQELHISQCVGLENSLPLLLQGLNSLSILKLKHSSITSLPSAEVFRRLTSLTELFVEQCNKLTSLGGLQALPHLYRLDMHGCPKLLQAETLTREENNPGQEEGFRLTADNLCIDNPLPLLTVPLRSLSSVQASHITNLEENFLPSSLQQLCISQCFGLENSLPLLLQGLNSLSLLKLGCSSITSLPSAEVFRRLTSLTELFIKQCNELTSLGGLQALPHLYRLEIYECPKLLQAETLTKEENNPGQEEGFRLTVHDLYIDNPLLLLTVPLRSLSSVQRLVVCTRPRLRSMPREVDHWLSQNHPHVTLL